MINLRDGNIIEVVSRPDKTAIDSWVRENNLTFLSYKNVDFLMSHSFHLEDFVPQPVQVYIFDIEHNEVYAWTADDKVMEEVRQKKLSRPNDEFAASIDAYRLLNTIISCKFHIPKYFLNYTFQDFLQDIWKERTVTGTIPMACIPFLRMTNQNTLIIFCKMPKDTVIIERVISTTL